MNQIVTASDIEYVERTLPFIDLGSIGCHILSWFIGVIEKNER